MESVAAAENSLFISWIAFHGRSEGLARALSIPSVFIDGGEGSIFRRYLRQWHKTRAILKRARPRQIIVMQPPVVALLAIRCTAVGRRARIVGDLHTGSFVDPKWAWALKLTLSLVGSKGLIVVTNSTLAHQVQQHGHTALVIHDLIEQIPPHIPPLQSATSRILVPLAYAHDEPLEEILKAAAATPSIEWRLTGRAPEWIKAQAPANVKLLGYISNDDYWREFEEATAIAALTTEENTMQRAGYEAMSRGKALLTTDMRVLRDYFGDAAVYARPTADSLAVQSQLIVSDAEQFADRMIRRRAEQMLAQDAALEGLRSWLNTLDR